MKRSGFAVKITAFIEADPKDVQSMMEASACVDGIKTVIEDNGFVDTKVTSRFMLSREVPDEPKAQAIPASMLSDGSTAGPITTMPPIPAPLRRA